jgi:hypothetical protein
MGEKERQKAEGRRFGNKGGEIFPRPESKTLEN